MSWKRVSVAVGTFVVMMVVATMATYFLKNKAEAKNEDYKPTYVISEVQKAVDTKVVNCTARDQPLVLAIVITEDGLGLVRSEEGRGGPFVAVETASPLTGKMSVVATNDKVVTIFDGVDPVEISNDGGQTWEKVIKSDWLASR